MPAMHDLLPTLVPQIHPGGQKQHTNDSKPRPTTPKQRPFPRPCRAPPALRADQERQRTRRMPRQVKPATTTPPLTAGPVSRRPTACHPYQPTNHRSHQRQPDHKQPDRQRPKHHQRVAPTHITHKPSDRVHVMAYGCPPQRVRPHVRETPSPLDLSLRPEGETRAPSGLPQPDGKRARPHARSASAGLQQKSSKHNASPAQPIPARPRTRRRTALAGKAKVPELGCADESASQAKTNAAALPRTAA